MCAVLLSPVFFFFITSFVCGGEAHSPYRHYYLLWEKVFWFVHCSSFVPSPFIDFPFTPVPHPVYDLKRGKQSIPLKTCEWITETLLLLLEGVNKAFVVWVELLSVILRDHFVSCFGRNMTDESSTQTTNTLLTPSSNSNLPLKTPIFLFIKKKHCYQ